MMVYLDRGERVALEGKETLLSANATVRLGPSAVGLRGAALI